MTEFVVGHINYWIVIVLMMTGLYVVISTGNLVKKLVGLGVFQTSVFQLYITMAKVAGGQPPILNSLPEHGAGAESHAATPGEGANAQDTGHGNGHEQVHEQVHDVPSSEAPIPVEQDNGIGDGATPLDELIGQEAAHDAPAEVPVAVVEQGHVAPDHVAEMVDPLLGVVYSNPLPHVLILTAIVVGVATLAVGLAMVVRIRESFGSIEEADINAAEYAQDAGSK